MGNPEKNEPRRPSRREFLRKGLIFVAGISIACNRETIITSPTKIPTITLNPEASPAVNPESHLVFFREDFNGPGLEGWDVYLRGGKAWLEDGWLNLEAPFGSTTFPKIERRGGIFPPQGSFEFQAKLDFPEKTGHGVYFYLLDEEGRCLLEIGGGRCANPYVRTALNNGKEVNPFMIFKSDEYKNYNNGWDGSLSNPDMPHTFSLFYKNEVGYLFINGTYVMKLSNLPRPVGVRMGNPDIAPKGRWTKMGLDFLEVRQASIPSFVIPEAPPYHKLKLFRAKDGYEIRKMSSLAFPLRGGNGAIEFEGQFSNFSSDLDKHLSIQLGDLEIRSGKGGKPFITLSAGKKGEKFGFLIAADVGKPVKGREILHCPKKPHVIRLVYLGETEYLFVDGILVGQGPREEIKGGIPIKISEKVDLDATKVKIDTVRVFSVIS